MKKFLLRRIGVADDRSSQRPSLHDCLEVVLSQAGVVMGDVLDGLVVLTSPTQSKGMLAERSAVNQKLSKYLMARAEPIKRTFTAHLRAAFYQGGEVAYVETPAVRFDDLQLFDSQQIDASIEYAVALQEVARSVDEVLPTLSALVSSLLGWITVQAQLNPLRPDAFVRALQHSIKEHAPDDASRAALLVPCAGLLGVSLRQLYKEVSDWLRSQGVEPALPLGTPVGSADQVHNVQSSVSRTLVTLDKLRKLLSGELEGASARQDFLHTVPASLSALEDMQMVEPMMRRLAQRARAPVLTARIGEPMQTPRKHENGQSKALGQQLGSEVVRMMLDNLMQDNRLLPPVRGLIRSLEPALLSLARADARFFSERQHPARLLLDRITHRSLAYTAQEEDDFSHFLDTVTEAVANLKAEQADAAAFALVVQTLEDGWSKEDAKLRAQHEEAARALLRAEQRNLLAQRLAEEFTQRYQNKLIPELVSGFLHGPWAQVVAQSQLGCADGSVDPDGYMALIDDLVWSVQYRLARRNRERLVQLVPTLLIKLRQGLQSIAFPQERILQFFDALITLHEKAFEGPRQTGTGRPETETLLPGDDAAAAPVPEALEEMDFWTSDEETLDAAYLADGVEPLTPSAQRPWSVGDLSPGMWVELIVHGVWLRAQLTWASPHRTLFMFISRGGLAHSMSRRTIERLRMQGRVRFVSDGHVIDNALDAVAQAALENDLDQVKQDGARAA